MHEALQTVALLDWGHNGLTETLTLAVIARYALPAGTCSARHQPAISVGTISV
jgi:hypothetical protein